VEALLAGSVIEESCSPWASPVVLVKKKCGQWRFCVDYRCLNSVTVKDCHPLPHIDDTLDRWYSTFDFSNGYWQVEVAEEDREKTTFTTGQVQGWITERAYRAQAQGPMSSGGP